MAMADDVNVDRLVHTFNTQEHVMEPMKIPQLAKMGRYGRRSDGEVVMIFLVCSPEEGSMLRTKSRALCRHQSSMSSTSGC